MTDRAETAGDKEAGKEFKVQKLYIKKHNFESPGAPDIFKGEWNPKIEYEIKVNNQKLEDHHHEVTMRIRVTAKNEHQTAFTCDIEQAGAFLCKGLSEEELKHVLAGVCPTTLYTQASRLITASTVDAGFPPLYMQPMNFETIYMQEQMKQKAQSEKAGDEIVVSHEALETETVH